MSFGSILMLQIRSSQSYVILLSLFQLLATHLLIFPYGSESEVSNGEHHIPDINRFFPSSYHIEFKLLVKRIPRYENTEPNASGSHQCRLRA